MKYSIIIPAYNIEKYISKLLVYIHETLLIRNDVEFVVINDGSTDKTHDLLFCNKEILYLKQENQGVSAARNKGIQLATGNYLLFLDADDDYSKDIFCVLDSFVNYNADMFFFNYSINGRIMNLNRNSAMLSSELILNSFFKRKFKFHICSICFCRNFIKNNNLVFKEGFAWSEDTHFVLNSLASTKKDIFYINKTLFNYNLQPGGAVNSIVTYNKASALYVNNDITDKINAIPSTKENYKYYCQRGYIYMLKKALTNNVDSIETLVLCKKHITTLNDSINIATPLNFRAARFFVKHFNSLIFFIIKNKSKI